MSIAAKINKRILVAPLDWGLGHATRCIPVIRLLQAKGCEVLIATSGPQETLLKAEFPDATFLHLPGYGVRYGKRGVMLRLLRQIPVIRRHIFTEHAWLQQAIHQYGIDGVISDNRYGLYSNRVPNVLITHQLALQLPRWALPFRSGVQQMLYHHLEHFGEVWVPDLPEEAFSLAGAMSHPSTLPALSVKYIGWLSRFCMAQQVPTREDALLISLSGPEPQRSLLEEKVLEQVPRIHVPVWLVRGLPGEADLPAVSHLVKRYNHLPAATMQNLMLRCRIMISRSGYSTLMDALALGTPIACIPTPGQTEQEYLAQRLNGKGWAITQTQDQFNLEKILGRLANTSIALPKYNSNGLLNHTLEDWLKKC